MCCNKEFMQQAILQAQIAANQLEVPVGAVIVYGNEVISTGYNKRELAKNSLAHAEIEAINNACNKLDRWRLSGCTLYVTLEPCPMCMGAIINSRIDKVIFGAYDSKAGACGSVLNLTKFGLNHDVIIEGGILESECATLLSEFFKNLRKKNK